MRIEALVYDGFYAAVCAHLDDIEPPRVGAFEHPVFLLQLREYAFN